MLGGFQGDETDNNIQLAFIVMVNALDQSMGFHWVVFDGDGDGDLDLVLGDISSRELTY